MNYLESISILLPQSDSHLKLSEGLDDNNPMITIVFKPEDMAG